MSKITVSKTLNKRIEYIQKALKQDEKKYPDRPINEFAELVHLIGDQFDDMYNLKGRRTINE